MIWIWIVGILLYFVTAITVCASRFPECLNLPRWLEDILAWVCLIYALPAIAVMFILFEVIPFILKDEH